VGCLTIWQSPVTSRSHFPALYASDAPAGIPDGSNVLIPEADGLITLTAGAAAEVAARWGRRPTVLPHPHVVDLDRPTRPRASGPSFVIGVHAKSVRASMAPLPVIRVLAEVVAALPGGRLRVDIHHDVFDQ